MPGNVGGMAWGGMAHDRVNDLLVMPVNNIAAEVRLIPRGDVETERNAGRLGGDFEFACAAWYALRARAAVAAGSEDAAALHAAHRGAR